MSLEQKDTIPGVSGLAHLGLAVEDLERARAVWEALGLKVTETHEVPTEKVRTAHLPFCAGGAEIELLEPTADDSPIALHLAKRGPGLHHIAFKVPDIEAALVQVQEAGLRVIGQAPRIGAGGKRVAFLHPRSMGGVLVELVEHPE